MTINYSFKVFGFFPQRNAELLNSNLELADHGHFPVCPPPAGQLLLEHCRFPIWKWSGKCCPLNFSCRVKLGQSLQRATAPSDAVCYEQSLLNLGAFCCQLYIIWEWSDFLLINLHWIHSSPEKMNSGNYWVLQCCKSLVLFDCSVEKSIAANSSSFLEGGGLCRALNHLIK